MKTLATGGRNRSIEGLRGFAAVSVLVLHTYTMALKVGLIPPVHPALRPFAETLGVFGVCLFFCISGFLIVQSLDKHNDWCVFAKNRIARIYPLFLLLHLVMFTLGPIRGYEWMGSLRHHLGAYLIAFVSNLLFLPGVFNLPIAQKSAWSLSYEAAFYIVACLLFVGNKNRLQGKWIGYLFLTIGFAVSIWACYLRSFFLFFAVGALSYQLLVSERLKSYPGGPFGLLFLIGGFVVFKIDPLLSVPFLFFFFLSAVFEKGWFSAFLQTNVFQHLGKVSYSLYLVSPYVMDPLRALCHRFESKIGAAPAFMLFVILTFGLCPIVATISYELIERRLTKRIFPSSKSRLEAAPV